MSHREGLHFVWLIFGILIILSLWCDKLSAEFFIAKDKSSKFKGIFNHHFGTEVASYRVEDLF